MGWTTAMTVGSMALSAGQAKKQRKAAKEAASAQEAAMRESTEEQRRQYEEQKKLYQPVKEKLVGEAMSEVPTAYTRQAQQIEKQVSEAQRNLVGRPYGSGVLRSTQENMLLREAEAKAGAYGSAIDQQRDLRMQVAGFDPSVQLGAQYADAMNKKSIAMSNYYGNQRIQAEAAEAANWQNVSGGAFNVASDVEKYIRKKRGEEDPPKVEPVNKIPTEKISPVLPGQYGPMVQLMNPYVNQSTPVKLPWQDNYINPYKIKY